MLELNRCFWWVSCCCGLAVVVVSSHNYVSLLYMHNFFHLHLVSLAGFVDVYAKSSIR